MFAIRFEEFKRKFTTLLVGREGSRGRNKCKQKCCEQIGFSYVFLSCHLNFLESLPHFMFRELIHVRVTPPTTPNNIWGVNERNP